MAKMWAVVRFEFLTFVKTGSFIGISIFLIAVAAIGPTIPNIAQLIGGMAQTRNIAVVDLTGQFGQNVLAAHLTSEAYLFDNIEEARMAVADGQFNYAVELGYGQYSLYIVHSGVSVTGLLNQLDEMFRNQHRMEQFQGLGIDESITQTIFDFYPAYEIMVVSPTGEVSLEAPNDFMASYTYSFAMMFVLYFSILIGGQHIVTSVVREKSTKTMELLIVSCKSDYLISGKVLGVGACILLQLLLMLVVGGLSIAVNGALSEPAIMDNAFALALFETGVRMDLFVFMIIFFLLGFIMYSYIYAALSSTVSTMEDSVNMSVLPTMLIVAGFITAMTGMANAGTPWVTFMSHIPFFSPFVMFLRICFGVVTNWEIVVSIAAQIVTICVLAWAGSRLYRRGALMYGQRPKLSSIFKAVFAK